MSEWISFFFFAVAAVFHIGFFVLESFIMQKESYRQRSKLTPEQHKVVKVWALNQGFYNLFLALGMIVGLYNVLKLNVMVAGALTGFAALSMVGAGVVLFFSAPHLRKASLIQILPPLLGLIFVSAHVFKYL